MNSLVQINKNFDFHGTLLNWYDTHRRVLPWRALAGEKSDPYKVWLSEIMLQQTTVATVKSYFEKFTQIWPTVHDLANADLDDVLAAWAGLGYYARARNLHACANVVATEYDGQFPSDEKLLLKLPGIGPYTCGAISAIAFDKPFAAVDGNVDRVLSRFYAITEPLPASKPEIRQRADALMQSHRAGDFVQSLMDLGAMVCTPRTANCNLCPLAEACQGLALGIANELPKKQRKKPRPTRYGTAFVVQRGDGAVLLRKRPAKGLLGAMLEVPSTPWIEEVERETIGLRTVEHTFTHFHLVLDVVIVQDIERAQERPKSSEIWVDVDHLSSSALPTIMKKVLAKALGPDALKV